MVVLAANYVDQFYSNFLMQVVRATYADVKFINYRIVFVYDL